MPGLKERAKTLIELIDSAYFIFADRPLEIDAKAAALLTPESRDLIGRLLPRTRGRSPTGRRRAPKPTCAPSPTRTASSSARSAQPLRAALTGRTTSPAIFDVLAVLGREESLARLRDQAGRPNLRARHPWRASPT